MHIRKDPAKIDWNEAFEIFEKLRKRYNIDLSKDNKNFEERKKLKGLQLDLSYMVFRARRELTRRETMYFASKQKIKITFFKIEPGQNQPGQQASIKRDIFILGIS